MVVERFVNFFKNFKIFKKLKFFCKKLNENIKIENVDNSNDK